MIFRKVLSSADGAGAVAKFSMPACAAYSPDGAAVAVADFGNHRIRVVAAATGVVTTLAGSGAMSFADGAGGAAAFNSPSGVAASPDGAAVAVADLGNNRIRLVAAATGRVTTLSGSGAAAFADGAGAAAAFNPEHSCADGGAGAAIHAAGVVLRRRGAVVRRRLRGQVADLRTFWRQVHRCQFRGRGDVAVRHSRLHMHIYFSLDLWADPSHC
eukprot:gene18093-biopygen29198